MTGGAPDNYIGRLNEYMAARGEATYTKSDFLVQSVGPAHNPLFTCEVHFGEFVAQGFGEVKVKAKQEACRLLLRQLEDEQENAPPPTRTNAALQLQAMRGDAMLKVIVTEHFIRRGTSSAGELQNLIVAATNNEFLFERYQQIALAGNLPAGLPPPSNLVNRDPTQFEAWIGDMMDDGDSQAITPAVLGALGLAA